MARLAYEAGESLDFIDGDHLLVTFSPKKLIKRHPDCPPTHADRLMRAVVVDTSSSMAAKQEDWYLHDQNHYLWSLGSGQFLLRRLNTLYLVDSMLAERVLTTFPNPVLWVSVTPDKKQIIVETAIGAAAASSQSGVGSSHTGKATEPKFNVDFLDMRTLQPQRTLRLNKPLTLEGSSEGYADLMHSNDVWLVRFGPSPESRRSIARVRCRVEPRVLYSSNNSLLIGRNRFGAHDYSVSAFTVSGRRLWRQHWDYPRYFPTVARSEDGRRFGVSTVRYEEASDAASHTDPSDPEAVENEPLHQSIQVFETASGNAVFKVDVTPAVRDGRNFALSPDGRRLAVLQDSLVEVFELPQISTEEDVKYTALKADAPGLYMPSSDIGDIAAEHVPEETVAPSTEALSAFAATIEGVSSATPSPTAKPADRPVRVAGEDATVPIPDDPKDENEPVATFKAAAQAVVVDVVVTDGKGRPVNDLQEQDFKVSEDGVPQTFRSFRVVTRGQAATDARTAAPPPKLPANVFSNKTGTPDSGSVTVVLLDLLNTTFADQQYARQELMKFLKSKGPEMQFALCTLNSNRNWPLRLIQGFTSDENLLLAAINSKKGTARLAAWQGRAAGKEVAGADFQKNPRSAGPSMIEALQTMGGQQNMLEMTSRVDVTVDALMQLARYLSGIPGRKNLVWLSGSFPISVSAGAYLGDPRAETRNFSTKVKQATDLFARGHIAVYPVDVRGLDSSGFMAGGGVDTGPTRVPVAPRQGPRSSGPTSAEIEASLQQAMQDSASRSPDRSMMTQVAADTGGKAFYNGNSIKDAIVTANELGSNYYLLSYSPSNKKYDGRFRKIQVALARKGYHLYYRPGYYADDPRRSLDEAAKAPDIGKAAMQHGSPQAHEILFAAQVVPWGGKKRMNTTAPLQSKKTQHSPQVVEVQHHIVDFAISASDLRFYAGEKDIRRCTFQLMMAAFDENGQQLGSTSSVWTGDFTPDQYREVLKGGVRSHQEMDVPLQAVSLRLGVADRLGNRVGTTELPLPVPPPPDLPRLARHSLPEIEPD